MSEPISGINTADYMKLFMQELTYQDPLKPVDNREFMTQMAQFSALQQSQLTQEAVHELVGMTSGTQTLMLIGKKVKVAGSDELGEVRGVIFENNQPPKLNILMNGGTIKKILTDITEVQG
jgi:flagellar basal-body rod modification protein FlgD